MFSSKSRLILVQQYAWFAGVLCCPAALQAQNPTFGPPNDGTQAVVSEPLVSDRPGFGDGTNVLSAGIIQLESGLNVISQTDANVADRSLEAGSPLLRVGLGHRTELRVGGDGFVLFAHRVGSVVERVAGSADYSVGVKYALFSEKGLRPALTLIPLVSLPAGHQLFNSGGHDPTVKLAWSKSLGTKNVLSGDASISSVSDPRGRLAQSAASFQLSRELWWKVVGYGEAYLVTPVDRDHDRVWSFDTGLSRPIGRNAQVDVSAGQQVSPLIQSWYVSVGLVVRYSAWQTAHR
jgi:hypothetical protein